MRMLIVEDSSAFRRLLSTMLAPMSNLTVETADTLAEALACLRAGGVDMVLLDLELPDATKLEALRAIRGLAPDLPVVVVSGANVETEGPARLAGAQGYLVKATLTGEQLQQALRLAAARGAAKAAAGVRELEREIAKNV